MVAPHTMDAMRRFERHTFSAESRRQKLTLEELRQIVIDARASGTSAKTVEQIFAEAERRVRAKAQVSE